MKKSFCFIGLIAVVLTSLLSSCLTYKQIVNFQDGDDLKDGKIDSILNIEQVKIQIDDILQISVYSYNQNEANKFNTMTLQSQVQSSRSTGGSTVAEPLGYRVDSKGDLELPVIGIVHVENLTIEEVRNLVYNKVKETAYLQEFGIQVRYLSFKITVLGEVNAPGTFVIPSTKISVLEAIGLASDLTVFSNRDNLLVIREQEGKRVYGRLNMKSKNVFNSSFFYLKPNDIVYVEPHQSKILSVPDPATRYISTVLGIATLATLIITLTK